MPAGDARVVIILVLSLHLFSHFLTLVLSLLFSHISFSVQTHPSSVPILEYSLSPLQLKTIFIQTGIRIVDNFVHYKDNRRPSIEMSQEDQHLSDMNQNVDDNCQAVTANGESNLLAVQIGLQKLCGKPITNWADLADEPSPPPPHDVTTNDAESAKSTATVNSTSYDHQSHSVSTPTVSEVTSDQTNSIRLDTIASSDKSDSATVVTRESDHSLENTKTNDNNHQTTLLTSPEDDVKITPSDMEGKIENRVASENSYNTANLNDEELDDIDDDDTYETVDSDVSDNLFRCEDSDFASPELVDASSKTPNQCGQGDTVNDSQKCSHDSPVGDSTTLQVECLGKSVSNSSSNSVECNDSLPSLVIPSDSTVSASSVTSKSPGNLNESKKPNISRMKGNVSSNLPSTKSSLVSTSSSSVGTLPCHQLRSSIDDEDEIKRKPHYIPKRGAFYEHDDRLGINENETPGEQVKPSTNNTTTSIDCNIENTQVNCCNSSSKILTSDKVTQVVNCTTSASGQIEPTSGSQISINDSKKNNGKSCKEVSTTATNVTTTVSTTDSSISDQMSSGPSSSTSSCQVDNKITPNTNATSGVASSTASPSSSVSRNWNGKSVNNRHNDTSHGKHLNSSSSTQGNNNRSHYHSSHYYHHSNNYHKSSQYRGNIEADRWGHDLFNEHEQQPKSHAELYTTYGYDIRKNDTTQGNKNINTTVTNNMYSNHSGKKNSTRYTQRSSRNWRNHDQSIDDNQMSGNVFYSNRNRSSNKFTKRPSLTSQSSSVNQSESVVNLLPDGCNVPSTVTCSSSSSSSTFKSNSHVSNVSVETTVLNNIPTCESGDKNIDDSIATEKVNTNAAAAKIAARQAYQANEKSKHEREKNVHSSRNVSEDTSFHHHRGQQYLNSNIHRQRNHSKGKRNDSSENRNNSRRSRGAVFDKDDFSADLGGANDTAGNNKQESPDSDENTAKFIKKFSQVVEDRSSPIQRLAGEGSLTITSNNYPHLNDQLLNTCDRMYNSTSNDTRNDVKNVSTRKDTTLMTNDTRNRPNRNSTRRNVRSDVQSHVNDDNVQPSPVGTVTNHPVNQHQQQQQQPPLIQQQPQQSSHQTQLAQQHQKPKQLQSQIVSMVQQQQQQQQQMSPGQEQQVKTSVNVAHQMVSPSCESTSGYRVAVIPSEHSNTTSSPPEVMSHATAAAVVAAAAAAAAQGHAYYDPTVVTVQHATLAPPPNQPTHPTPAPSHAPELMAYGHTDAIASAYSPYNSPYLVSNQLSYMHPSPNPAGTMNVCPPAYLSTYPPSGFPSYPPQYHGHALAHPPAATNLPGPTGTSANSTQNSSAGEVFRGGITYYDTSTQQPIRALPPKRTKNILQIVPPPNYAAQVDSTGEI